MANLTKEQLQTSHRVSRLIERKLNHLASRNMGISKTYRDTEITALQLYQYRKGQKKLPLRHALQLFRFYGCSEATIHNWHAKLSVILMESFVRKT